MGRGDNQGAVPAEDAAEHVPPKAEELPRPLLVAWLGLGFRVRVRARVGLGLGLELGLWLGFHGLLVAVLLLRELKQLLLCELVRVRVSVSVWVRISANCSSCCCANW